MVDRLHAASRRDLLVLVAAGVLAIGLGLYLLFRNAGLYVSIADETVYSSLARQTPFSDSFVPDYLYFAVYKRTSLCGEGYLDCARLFNTSFFILGLTFIFLTALTVASRPVALVIAAVVGLSAVNTYTAYFMPESMFFFGFWVLTWVTTRIGSAVPMRRWLVVGLCLGLLALVKPHALFLTPGLVTYVAFISWRTSRHRLKVASATAALTVGAMLLTKLAIGFALAGSNGLTLFGEAYSGIATTQEAGADAIVSLIMNAAYSALGHLSVLLMIMAFPIALTLARVAERQPAVNGSVPAVSRLSAYALVTIVPMVLVTAVFTARVSEAGESLDRLHMRYYDFALPLLLICSSAYLWEHGDARPWLRKALIVAVAGASLLALVVGIGRFTPYLADAPLAQPLASPPWLMVLGVGGACVIPSLIALRHVAAGVKVYLFVALPVVFLLLSAASDILLRRYSEPDPYVTAGVIGRQLLSAADRARTVVVGPAQGDLYRALFYIDSPGATLMVAGNDDVITASMITDAGPGRQLATPVQSRQWAFLIGPLWSAEDAAFEVRTPVGSLVRLPGSMTLDLAQPNWYGVLAETSGLGAPEPGGRWTVGDTVQMRFEAPLPESFLLSLVGSANGPNVDQPIIVKVGDEIHSFTMESAPRLVTLGFTNPSRADTIQLQIPYPTSPTSLGSGNDQRELGLFLRGMEVDPGSRDALATPGVHQVSITSEAALGESRPMVTPVSAEDIRVDPNGQCLDLTSSGPDPRVSMRLQPGDTLYVSSSEDGTAQLFVAVNGIFSEQESLRFRTDATWRTLRIPVGSGDTPWLVRLDPADQGVTHVCLSA